jgi:hypothetical protein
MGHVAAIPVVGDRRAERRRQSQPLIELPDEEQPASLVISPPSKAAVIFPWNVKTNRL